MSSNEAKASEGSHAEAMDAIYRTQRHIYDLTRKYYLLGRDRLIADLAPPRGGTVPCNDPARPITAANPINFCPSLEGQVLNQDAPFNATVNGAYTVTSIEPMP